MSTRAGRAADRDARFVALVEELVAGCEAVGRELGGRRAALSARLRAEARSARADALGALAERDAAEKERRLRSALYATRQVERLLRPLQQRSRLPPDLATQTADLILALRMEFLRRLLR